ncbi:MAG: gamma-glutamyltransferase 1 [Verrucomicrobiaceae bacterium]|nr:gamma-glutamyltransferase 1 [Verrucomicrobiaceae bacterium]
MSASCSSAGCDLTAKIMQLHRLLQAALLLSISSVRAELAQAEHGMVASVHTLATEAGVNASKNGGNAIDAAVAVALTLGVVDGHNSGIGGGCFMLIHLANGKVVALDGREMAPATASRDMFVRNGKGDTNLSQTGSLASGVPGALAVYAQAVEKYGRKPLAALLLPAAQIAEDGFPIDFVYARKLTATADKLRQFESPKAIFFKTDGSVLAKGEVLKQADLAKSYRAIAKDGADWFYKGEYAKAVAAWMKANGGMLTEADFSGYTVKQREPFSTTYRGFEVIGLPPPSSGGVHVAEILNILENFDLKGATAPGARHHLMAEAMKLAFADRAYWLGDPDFVNVPRGLVDKGYAKGLAARINPDHTTPVPSHSLPPDAETKLFEKHTTHFSTVDAEGNWVACTATVNTAFGSKVIVPGTGIFLNDEMDDFSIEPGVPNAFKLVGAEANAVAPKKRPLSSMSPTLVLKDGKPILALGAAGGPTIISQTVLNLIAVLDLGKPLDEALGQPRIHQQWQPDEVRIEKAMPADIREALKQHGHEFFEENTFGASQAVGLAPDGKGFVGASDPRTSGKAAGF